MINKAFVLLSLLLVNTNIQSQARELSVSFKTQYCIKDPLYYTLEANYFVNIKKFWVSVLNFEKDSYINENPIPQYYNNPDD